MHSCQQATRANGVMRASSLGAAETCMAMKIFVLNRPSAMFPSSSDRQRKVLPSYRGIGRFADTINVPQSYLCALLAITAASGYSFLTAPPASDGFAPFASSTYTERFAVQPSCRGGCAVFLPTIFRTGSSVATPREPIFTRVRLCDVQWELLVYISPGVFFLVAQR